MSTPRIMYNFKITEDEDDIVLIDLENSKESLAQLDLQTAPEIKKTDANRHNSISSKPRSNYRLAQDYFNGWDSTPESGVVIDKKNYKEAVKYFKLSISLSETSDGLAEHYIGLCYSLGENGLESNYVEANEWFLKGANKGCSRAQFHLGLSYLHGKSVDENHKQAIKWFEESAKREQDGGAESYIGHCYYRGGPNLKSNLDKAMDWYKKAIIKGNHSALSGLAKINKEKKNFDEAIKLYLQSVIKNGMTFFDVFNIAECYLSKRNLVEAKKWFLEAESSLVATHIVGKNTQDSYKKSISNYLKEIADETYSMEFNASCTSRNSP